MNKLSLQEIAPHLLTRGLAVRFVARGQSMVPYILDGDRVEIEPLDSKMPCPGAVVLSCSDDRLILHRVVRIREDPTGAYVTTKGDAVASADPEIQLEQVLGQLRRIKLTPKQLAKRLLLVRRWPIWARDTYTVPDCT